MAVKKSTTQKKLSPKTLIKHEKKEIKDSKKSIEADKKIIEKAKLLHK